MGYVAFELSEAARSTSRLYNGIRRIDVSLPVVLVAELDRNLLELAITSATPASSRWPSASSSTGGGVTGQDPGPAHR